MPLSHTRRCRSGLGAWADTPAQLLPRPPASLGRPRLPNGGCRTPTPPPSPPPTPRPLLAPGVAVRAGEPCSVYDFVVHPDTVKFARGSPAAMKLLAETVRPIPTVPTATTTIAAAMGGQHSCLPPPPTHTHTATHADAADAVINSVSIACGRAAGGRALRSSRLDAASCSKCCTSIVADHVCAWCVCVGVGGGGRQAGWSRRPAVWPWPSAFHGAHAGPSRLTSPRLA